MNGRSYLYRLFDVREMTSEDVEFTVEVSSGDTVRAGSGRLMLVFAVVEVDDAAGYAGVLLVEPAGG